MAARIVFEFFMNYSKKYNIPSFPEKIKFKLSWLFTFSNSYSLSMPSVFM